MKEQRDAGIESEHRKRDIEGNLKLFEDMVSGKITDYCIRAKMNM